LGFLSGTFWGLAEFSLIDIPFGDQPPWEEKARDIKKKKKIVGEILFFTSSKK